MEDITIASYEYDRMKRLEQREDDFVAMVLEAMTVDENDKYAFDTDVILAALKGFYPSETKNRISQF